jgi:putative Mg2+ transporter-C (MgtC) family protein
VGTVSLLALQTDTTFSLDGDAVVRLLVAAVLGGIIGLEREATEQSAGLRTHIAVALGASLFGVVSTLGFLEFDQQRANTVIQADVTRVASNVVVGIGFLGAGVIFRRGNTIKNLTTAASLWTVAAIGLACGVGDVTTAALAAAVLLGSLVLLRPLRSFVRERWGARSSIVHVHLRSGSDVVPVIEALERADDVETSRFTVEQEDSQVVVTSEVAGASPALRRWIASVAAAPGVESVREGR